MQCMRTPRETGAFVCQLSVCEIKGLVSGVAWRVALAPASRPQRPQYNTKQQNINDAVTNQHLRRPGAFRSER